jgi:hypothetical protein
MSLESLSGVSTFNYLIGQKLPVAFKAGWLGCASFPKENDQPPKELYLYVYERYPVPEALIAFKFSIRNRVAFVSC